MVVVVGVRGEESVGQRAATPSSLPGPECSLSGLRCPRHVPSRNSLQKGGAPMSRPRVESLSKLSKKGRLRTYTRLLSVIEAWPSVTARTRSTP